MLQTIHNNYPDALNSSDMFKSIASDILCNDAGGGAIISWLDIALFELNALQQFKACDANYDNSAISNLTNELVGEGASIDTTKEVIGYTNLENHRRQHIAKNGLKPPI